MTGSRYAALGAQRCQCGATRGAKYAQCRKCYFRARWYRHKAWRTNPQRQSGQPSMPGNPSLDELIDSAMTGILAKLQAGFNPSAGLADIYARCNAIEREVIAT